jgi:hypothetical protein
VRTKFWSVNTTGREIMQALGADKRMDDNDDDDTMDVKEVACESVDCSQISGQHPVR